MDELSNYIRSTSIESMIEPEVVKEKLFAWSASAYSKLTYSNVRDSLAGIGRSLDRKNIEQKTLSYFDSAALYLADNPIIFSVALRNEIQTYINLPYFGAVSLDVFLFWSSAVLSRAHMFWWSRRRTLRRKRDDLASGDSTFKPLVSQDPPSPPVKSTIVTGYEDKGLYQTMRECQDVKKSLRKPTDPELLRKQKKTQVSLQNIRTKIKGENTSDGYLPLSPNSLYNARRFLKKTPRNQTTRNNSL